MKILADENISTLLVARLRQEGHQVQYIMEIASGSEDLMVLDLANQQDALLITEDRDFGELVFLQGLKASGVILIRLKTLTPSEQIELVIRVIRTYGDQLLQSFSVIKPHGVRIRPM